LTVGFSSCGWPHCISAASRSAGDVESTFSLCPASVATTSTCLGIPTYDYLE
jgi:hypothetical protein